MFPERRQARNAVSRARKALGGVVRGGTPVYLKRKLEHGTSWKALLVGFKEVDDPKLERIRDALLRTWLGPTSDDA